LTFAGRGFDTAISYFGPKDAQGLACENCRACVSICPVAALALKNGPPS
jgi:ferredoxin